MGDQDASRQCYPPAAKRVFVDAYGDTGLSVEKEGATTFFIVAAVLVDGGREDAFRAEVDALRKRHFGPGPIKSANVSDKKRLVVLAELNELDFRYVAIAIDKARVPRDGGFVFGGSFIKFMHGKLFDRLFARHPDLHITSDRTGHEEFMDGFRSYILDRVKPDLFRRAAIDFGGSRCDPLIQVADFIAGSLARIYDPKKLASTAEEVHELLRPRALWVIDWPKRFRARTSSPGAAPEFDDLIKRHSLERAQQFLRQHADSTDPEWAAPAEALSYLLFQFEAYSETDYVPTAELRDYLGELRLNPASEQQFRSKVFAKLRDNGVLLASSSHGYKIPANVSDMVDFADRTDTVVLPMLNRLQSAREAVKDITGGELDILADPRFDGLKRALEGHLFAGVNPDVSRAG